MKIKILLFVNLVLVGFAIALYLDRSTGPRVVPPAPNTPVPPETQPPRVDRASNVSPQPVDVSKTNVVPASPPQSNATRQDQPLMINGYAVQDPLARAALSLVGTDPDADAYWMGAINDPNLPSEERKDLIEDLNEDGLSDPKHPGPEDAPLIAARIQLIEQLAPYSMDQVNVDAFAEAEKDLVGMLNGQPPQ
jgi:hypothetical protein